MSNQSHSALPAPTGTRVPASFGAIDKSPDGPDTDQDFIAIAASPEFQELRRRMRRFVFSMSALFFAWYMVYVITAAYLPEFMAIRLVGEINVGLVMGVGQFVSTILITMAYLRFARRQTDPRVRRIRSAIGVETR